MHKQQEFYPNLITDNFIEACISTIKARIPYYIGPLSSQVRIVGLIVKMVLLSMDMTIVRML